MGIYTMEWIFNVKKGIIRKLCCSSFVDLRYSVLIFAILLVNTAFVSVQAAAPSSNDFRFTLEPEDTIGVRDNPAILNCSASHGGEAPKMLWHRDEVELNLEGDNRRQMLPSGSLKFDNIVHTRSHRPDEGIYQCVASVNGLGTIVSRKAKLQVAYLDKNFEAEPRSLSVHLGDTAIFECRLGGAPLPTVRWYKDDLEVDTDLVNYQLHLDGTLEIRSVHFSDFGKYKCRVENVDRSRYSEEAALTQNSDVATYQGVAPHLILEPKDQMVLEGSTIELHCAANGRDEEGNPPKITWLRDGVTIDMADLDSRFSLMGQGTLIILNVMEGDEGMYTCRSTNLEDSVDADATVSVHVAPRFQRRPTDTSAGIHTDAVFMCDVFGAPAPSIIWRKNGEEIINSQYFQISDSGRSLKILGLVETDQGMYQCFAENQAGNVQASAKLSIMETGSEDVVNSDTPSEPTFLAVAVGSTRFITLTWRPPNQIGTSEIITYTVYWNEEGSERNRMMNTSIMEANIQGLEPATQYRVRVMALNKAGSGPAASIMVQTKEEVNVPSLPLNLEAITLSSTSILLRWNPPSKPNGIITKYTVSHYKDGEDEEHESNVGKDDPEHILVGLDIFTNYHFHVTAFNANGAGTATEEVSTRTYSDVPSNPPQNATIEAVSSTTLLVRWEPPPVTDQNGVITGYKLRFKKDGDRKGMATTVDANQRSYALKELAKGAEYQVRLSAINVNGSGPPTEWMDAATYEYDLDESTVPGQPVSMNVRAMTNSIMVAWIPPAERDIRIDGYILGYGVGIPDVYKLWLDKNQRLHTIKGLEPGTNYVISLRAYNKMGEGRPRLESGTTRRQNAQEPQTPMTPPLGLKALVLSPSTILLTWTDNSLGRNQRITDQRYYTVQYRPSSSSKYKYLNATDVNVHIENLKANTEYDFSVKVVKGRRQSSWSMSTVNKTFESAPASAPRDLTPVGVQGHPTWVTLSWQPPRQANGLVTGYVVLYTTDSSQRDREWVVNGVVGGEQLSTTIRDLTADTTYFFKIQARNNKGMGPVSPSVVFRTPTAKGAGGGRIVLPDDNDVNNNRKDGNKQYMDGSDVDKYFDDAEAVITSNGIPPLVLYISIGCVALVTIIAVVVVSVFMCIRRGRNNRMNAYKASNKSLNKPGPKDLKPPDLWIHHEQVELKGMEKNPDGIMAVPEEMKPLNPDHHSGMEMDKRRNSFISDRNYDPRDKDRYLRTPVRSSKPIMISVEQPPPPREPIVTALPNGGIMMHHGSMGGLRDPDSSAYVDDEDGCEDGIEEDEMVPSMPLVHPTPIRPVYPRTQYQSQYTSTPRVHGGDLSSQPSSEEYYTSTMERRKPKTNHERMRLHGSTSMLTGPHSPLESPAYSNQHAPIPYDQLQHHHPLPSSDNHYPLHMTNQQQIPPPAYQQHPQHYPPSSPPPSSAGSLPPQSPVASESGSGIGNGTKSLQRPGNPLKSFSVPGPPSSSSIPQLYTSTNQVPKHIVKPQPQQQPQQLPQQQPSSPYKKPVAPGGGGGVVTTMPITPVKGQPLHQHGSSTPTSGGSGAHSPMPINSPKSQPDVTLRSDGESDMPKSFSTEELTAEMANLEGLMKDLNAITQQQFEC